MWVLAHFSGLWVQRLFNIQSLCSVIFTRLGLSGAPRVPIGYLLVLPDVEGIHSGWGVGAAECLFVGDDWDEILLLVLLSHSVPGQKSKVSSPWLQEGFLDPTLAVAFCPASSACCT